ncbi:phospholipase-like protein [Tanacetum coccineum]|uniref:Phospholipase-like protein n=1 Tax=Tanacetum coccineum TaxID=301880 RepID=A0ABQ5C238_9ASTR
MIPCSVWLKILKPGIHFLGEHLWCHLNDEIKNLKERHGDEYYYGLFKDRNYVPTYTLSGFVFAFHESRSTSDLRPTIAEYQSSWWINNNLYFQEFVPRAPPIKEHHGLFETYLSKLEKARKHGKTGFMVSSIGGTNDNSVRKKWLNDLVIMELNFCLFKLETIIQAKLKFTDEFLSMTSDLYDSLNIMFADLIKLANPDEDIGQDYLREEELRLCLEGKEKMRCEHQKLIVEENRNRLDESKRLRFEEENMLQLEQQKKNKRKELMNSNHCKNLLSKLAPVKRIQLCSSSEMIQPKVSWVKNKKYRQKVYDPCTTEFLKTVKPWVEDTSRVLQSMDTIWLSDDIEHPASHLFVSLNEHHIDLWVDYMWHVRPENSNWAMVSCYFVQLLLQNGMPLFYANGERYTTTWSEVDQVFIPINETGEHWCLAQFHIMSGEVQLPVVLERANIFQKNGIDPSKYTITLAHGLSLDVDDPVDVALSFNAAKELFFFTRPFEYIINLDEKFSQKPSISSMDNSKRIDYSTENYSLFEVNYDGMFDELPLRYAYGKVLPLKLSNSNRKTYSKFLDMLVYKLECEIRALFYSIPRNSHGNLALMTFDEIRSLEKEQSISPLLRTPPIKKRRKGIAFQGKNLYADFLHADCVDDHFDVLDHWSYEDVYGGGCFDVSGSFKGFDCIEEPVGCDDGSLPVKIKDEFENEVILDDVVSSPPNLSMLSKRKGKSRVKFTRMTGIIKRSKMVSLRMRVRTNY